MLQSRAVLSRSCTTYYQGQNAWLLLQRAQGRRFLTNEKLWQMDHFGGRLNTKSGDFFHMPALKMGMPALNNGVSSVSIEHSQYQLMSGVLWRTKHGQIFSMPHIIHRTSHSQVNCNCTPATTCVRVLPCMHCVVVVSAGESISLCTCTENAFLRVVPMCGKSPHNFNYFFPSLFPN